MSHSSFTFLTTLHTLRIKNLPAATSNPTSENAFPDLAFACSQPQGTANPWHHAECSLHSYSRINTPVTKLSLATKAGDQAKKDALPAATDAMHGDKQTPGKALV